MVWCSKEIKDLRWKLGWSQAEFGRRLGLNLASTVALENGTLEIHDELADQLLMLASQLEDYSKNLKASSLSNQHCKSVSKTQASTQELEEFANHIELK